MQVELPAEKHCRKCDTIKPASDFSIAKSTYKEKIYYSLQSSCKPCMVQASRLHQKSGYVRPASKVLNDHKEIKLMQRAPSWAMQKTGYEKSEYKIYPTCQEGHRYVGPECLPCKYALVSMV